MRTGSLLRNSSMIVLQSAGFSTRRPCEVPGMTASSASGRPRYNATACSKVTSAASPKHHQGAAPDAAEVPLGQGRLARVHLGELCDDDRIVVRAVGR